MRNHPFLDGKKPTGFLAGILFLELDGYRFTASEEGATQAIFALADSSLSESDFTDWLRAHSLG